MKSKWNTRRLEYASDLLNDRLFPVVFWHPVRWKADNCSLVYTERTIQKVIKKQQNLKSIKTKMSQNKFVNAGLEISHTHEHDQFHPASVAHCGSLLTQFCSTAISWTHISQGRAATRLRCGGIFNNHFTAHLLLNQPVKEFWQVLSSSSDGRPFGHNC